MLAPPICTSLNDPLLCDRTQNLNEIEADIFLLPILELSYLSNHCYAYFEFVSTSYSAPSFWQNQNRPRIPLIKHLLLEAACSILYSSFSAKAEFVSSLQLVLYAGSQ